MVNNQERTICEYHHIRVLSRKKSARKKWEKEGTRFPPGPVSQRMGPHQRTPLLKTTDT